MAHIRGENDFPSFYEAFWLDMKGAPGGGAPPETAACISERQFVWAVALWIQALARRSVDARRSLGLRRVFWAVAWFSGDVRYRQRCEEPRRQRGSRERSFSKESSQDDADVIATGRRRQPRFFYWPAHASTSARKRPGSIAGAFLKIATTDAAVTNRWRRRGVSSPTGIPLRVTTKDSPWSSGE